MAGKKVMRVAVLIDHRPNHPAEIGGLAGTWEQISVVAAKRSELELTVFFLGDTFQVLQKGINLKHVLVPPTLGTEHLPFLKGIPTHTDLTLVNPLLFTKLNGFDILHTTNGFHAFAKTASWRSRMDGVPLINSVHTDIIGWARIHTPGVLMQLLRSRCLVRWLIERFRFLDRQESFMERRFSRYIRRCRAVFVSHERDRKRIERLAPFTPISFLRRGIDLTLFHPDRRNRPWLVKRFDIPPERNILLFVGRIDPVKGPLFAASVTRVLMERGQDVHLFMAGNGSQRDEIKRLLHDRVTLAGNLPQDELAWIYASSDLLLFPSEAEVWPNVVAEARACGLTVIAPERGAGHMIGLTGCDGILMPDLDLEAWSKTAQSILARPELLREMGRNARKYMETHACSWDQILDEDILPVWSRFS